MRPAGFVWILIVAYFAFFGLADVVVAGAAKKTSANRATNANLRLRRIKLRADIICPPQSRLKISASHNDVVNLHPPRANRFLTTLSRPVRERSSESVSVSATKVASGSASVLCRYHSSRL